VFMLVLFIAELWAFLSTNISTAVVIDPNTESLLRINFNITVLDMPCEYATIDVVDVLGTRSENVSLNINKWQVDAQGIRRNYEGRNLEQRELEHDTHHDLDLLHRNGVHAVPVDERSFEPWLEKYDYTMVNFYAPWCLWCQRLEPVWEAFAEKMTTDEMPVSVVKVDCVANRKLCLDQHIQAFPLVRMFKKGVVQPPDYRSDRTLEAFSEFVNQRLAKDEVLKSMAPHEREKHEEKSLEERDDHPGCMMSGFLLVNRVPGNFHVEMRSKNHNINPPGANMSHVVNSLSFGPSISKSMERKMKLIPDDYFSIENTRAMDDRFYINDKLHQAFHHYIKVVSTSIEVNKRYMGENSVLAYQMVQSSQIMQYTDEEIPEARFAYDLSPMSVRITRTGKHWYEFLTSMCALIGGTFTVVGLLSGFLGTVFKPKKI
jgi:protein disulfide-isomerase-like protein